MNEWINKQKVEKASHLLLVFNVLTMVRSYARTHKHKTHTANGGLTIVVEWKMQQSTHIGLKLNELFTRTIHIFIHNQRIESLNYALLLNELKSFG